MSEKITKVSRSGAKISEVFWEFSRSLLEDYIADHQPAPSVVQLALGFPRVIWNAIISDCIGIEQK